jgi:hypothetical protein
MTISAIPAKDVKVTLRTMYHWARSAQKEAIRYSRKAKAERFHNWDDVAQGYRQSRDSVIACARLLNGSFWTASNKKERGRAILLEASTKKAAEVLANV